MELLKKKLEVVSTDPTACGKSSRYISGGICIDLPEQTSVYRELIACCVQWSAFLCSCCMQFCIIEYLLYAGPDSALSKV